MNYQGHQNVFSFAAQRCLNNNNSLTPYQIDLLKTIQTLHYKKFEIENHLLLAQHQFSQTQQSSNFLPNQVQPPTSQPIHNTSLPETSDTDLTNTTIPKELQNPENPIVDDKSEEESKINQKEIIEDENNVDIVCEQTENKFTYKNIINQYKQDENNADVLNTSNDLSILFKKFCRSCNYNKPNKFCKYIHENDENYYFYTLPLNKRCLRSVCFDFICLRVHHTLTKRLSIQCDKNPCNCKHYVHKNDTSENKPYFWKNYEESLPKPSYEECKNFFLLKTKEKK